MKRNIKALNFLLVNINLKNELTKTRTTLTINYKSLNILFEIDNGRSSELISVYNVLCK